ncbi:unnamed protein product [Rangifer tarandus platyrhynchus]|uniref:Uncharacterized protein n=1 Tax=Rangifer tarandus platyrhynchus TaxID=3082113 RepID=A0AC59YAE4_RANTA
MAQSATSPPAPPRVEMHQALLTQKPQSRLPVLLSLRAPTLSGPRAGVALPSLGHLESGSGILVFAGTRRPERTGHTSEGEYLLWVLHLPTDPMCVASGQGRSYQAWFVGQPGFMELSSPQML